MNPYQVLGVKETDSDEVIRKAYLKLVKKYHPDQFADNPLSELAQEKLKEINEAYDTITKQRSGGRTSGGYGSASSGGYGGGSGYTGSGSYTGEAAAEFARVRSLINANNITAARAALNGISVRNAEWYFLDGIIALRSGWYTNARDSLGKAVQMDPNNTEYRTAYNSVNNLNRNYTGNPYYGNADANTACSICQGLICADCCCECMGGDCIPCC
jgi:molecular chaperone DnaJ